ncbi:rho GDP-dissociation inhibitor 2-like [Mizuhopecten yessoensis]|uniref:Rho GDP-dissociation inhibitor 3 n=1 Tax=Mizuhopecten yessoensis TaxID=6573 RepID=A0A210QPF6_MIZYE|nr:rho GDP-dissociation inhibitor 2-like [Mizuhopecten yessoensis]XP_021353215.1 rho GDP-dissociation inhibitor 2-like [Mizuhopecten yessoensis]OWF50605.1 Rho GDP-dissociation inhibitor 2 [Mizuhopecten yessoensis]
MAESGEQVEVGQQELEEDEDDEVNPNYKAPEQKSMKEILEADKDDESLVNYKKQLMGENTQDLVIDPSIEAKVILKTLELRFEDAPDDKQSMDLTGDLSTLKEKKFEIVEGRPYRIAILFNVQRDIVTGLKYSHICKRKGVKVDKKLLMMGSYGPKHEPHCFQSAVEDTPSGLLARGTYNVKSTFFDDDKHKYTEFDWKFEIVKKK